MLAVYNWPKNSDRYRRVERFIQYYFERFDKLKQPTFHPKWKEINLAARVPGWNRYPAAEEALAAARGASTGTARQASSNEPLPAPARADASALEKSPLFEEFLEWRQKQQQQQQQQQQQPPQQKNRRN